jgi:hypothetical protein
MATCIELQSNRAAQVMHVLVQWQGKQCTQLGGTNRWQSHQRQAMTVSAHAGMQSWLLLKTGLQICRQAAPCCQTGRARCINHVVMQQRSHMNQLCDLGNALLPAPYARGVLSRR